jgi:ACT domain-containing protein
LKAQKSLESNAVTAAVSHGKRMTNSIPPFYKQKDLTFPFRDVSKHGCRMSSYCEGVRTSGTLGCA